MCNSMLGCVCLDPRKSPNNGMNNLDTRFPPVRCFLDFYPIIACEPGREKSMPVRTQQKDCNAGVFGAERKWTKKRKEWK